MKTLMLVITHPEAQATLLQNAATWAVANCDVYGVEHEDRPPMQWPAETKSVLRIGTGLARAYGPGNPLLTRFLKVFKWCASNAEALDYNVFCISEADVIFVRPVPEWPILPLGTRAGGKSEGFLGSSYFHPPWLISWEDMSAIVRYSERLLSVGLDERGFPDRFIGLLSDLYPDVGFQDSGNYSQNTLDQPHYMAEAIAAVKRPTTWACHGCKTKSQYDALIEALAPMTLTTTGKCKACGTTISPHVEFCLNCTGENER